MGMTNKMPRKMTIQGLAPQTYVAPLPTDPYERALFVTTYSDALGLGFDDAWARVRAHREIAAYRSPGGLFARLPAVGLLSA